jgi:hypothetical protein
MEDGLRPRHPSSMDATATAVQGRWRVDGARDDPNVKFAYEHGVLSVRDNFRYEIGVNFQRVCVPGVQKAPKSVKVKYGGKGAARCSRFVITP